MGVTIPFLKEMEFEYEVCETISPLIRRVVCNNPGPFTYTGTSTFIVGHGEVAILEPGPLNDAHTDAVVKALGDERATHIFVSHTHMDHSPGAAPLRARTGAKICAYGPHGLGGPEHDVTMETAGDRLFDPDIYVRDGDLFTGPDWTIECVHTPGHTSNHMCYALKEENVLFSGDHVMAWSTSIVGPPDGDMADYMDNLERILERDFIKFIPTHGPEISNPKEFVQAYLEHRYERERQIENCLRADTHHIKQMVPMIYSDVDSRLIPAAAVSLFSQIQRMVKLGRVVCEHTPPTLDSRYDLA